MKIVFVSNYINHHQIPFCNAMCRYDGVEFSFIQTEPMEEERVRMGWQESNSLPFLKLYYKEPEECRKLIDESELVLFGGCDDESYIVRRLKQRKPVIRISERLYKEAQWKAVSPRGLLQKYKDHTQYRRDQVYLLCAGGYVADDFHIVKAYPGKMYRWGYFPEQKSYDIESLLEQKGWYRDGERKVYLLWAARFIDWKHPELPIQTAAWLRSKGIPFHMDMVGGGEMEAQIQEMVRELKLEEDVSLLGYRTPEQVRSLMEKADIYLVTSDRKEGWGAVVNEAMNSGCTVIADHMIGAVPYLIDHGRNGLIYRDGDREQLYRMAEEYALNAEERRRLGRNAYQTIAKVWNAQNAADCLMELTGQLGILRDVSFTGKRRTEEGPCSPAPVIREQKMYGYLMNRTREHFIGENYEK